MTVNVTYREAGAVVPGATTIKNSPLSNGEIDGNFKSVKDAVEVLSTTSGAGLVGIVSPAGMSAVTVQGAIVELDSEKVNTANLAASSGSSLVGYDGGTVQDVLDGAVSKADYVELRAYTGRATRVYIIGLMVTAKPSGIAGVFQYDPTDTTSTDNGGTIIVGVDGRRWKRDFSGKIKITWFGTSGIAGVDDLSKIQAALNAHPGGEFVFDQDCFISGSVNVTSDNTKLVFTASAGLNFSTATNKAINSTANNVTISGGTFTAPTVFDGTNTQPLYSVIWMQGDYVTVEGVKLVNVPKVGIYIKDGNKSRVINNTIEGNYPSASYTGSQTGHAGVLVECGSSAPEGNAIVSGNIISGCVQGVLIANYGSVGDDSGITVSGNSFYNCWNHGVYGASNANGISVNGNSFNQCQVPVALTGVGHAVVGNTMQTTVTGRDVDVTGISIREAIGCVISNNTVIGDAANGSTVINIATFSFGTEISGNIISGNTVNVTGGSSHCIKVGNGTTATKVKNNIISGNVCSGNGRSGQGLILVIGTSGGVSGGNLISGNTVINKSDSHGIEVNTISGSVISNNSVRLEYDAASAKTVNGIYMNGATKTLANNNSVQVDSAWGANISYRAIVEIGSAAGNRTSDNLISLDTTKLSSAIQFVTTNGSGIVVNEAGAGAPNLNAGVGSIWRRTDGGTATTLYVKETGTGATGWVGK